MTYLRDRKNAMVYAVRGLWQVFLRESHVKLHALSTLLVCIAGWYFSVSGYEWIAIAAAITLVVVTEIINTAIEKACDLVTLEIRPEIRYIKDISAAAVLLACIFAVITGLIIFVPYLRHSI
jgi:diacylglycerol kinase